MGGRSGRSNTSSGLIHSKKGEEAREQFSFSFFFFGGGVGVAS